MGKEYTYKDWIEGKIENENLTSLQMQYIINPQFNRNNSFINTDEIKKIRDAQREAFHLAIKITSNTFIALAKKKVNNEVKDPLNWLRLETDEIEKFINENPDLEQKWEEGVLELSAITSEQYHLIKKMNSDFEKLIKSGKESYQIVGLTLKKDGKGTPCQLFDMYVRKEYLKALYEMRKKYSYSDTLTKEQNEMLDSLIEKIAEETSHKKSTKYESQTIITSLKEFLKNPKLSRANLIKDLNGKISKNDSDRLSEQVLEGWEKKLIERIQYSDKEFAQKLIRRN